MYKYNRLRGSSLLCSHCTSFLFLFSFLLSSWKKKLRNTGSNTDRVATKLFFLLWVLPILRTRRSNAPVSACASHYTTLFLLLPSCCRSSSFFFWTLKAKWKKKKRKNEREMRRDGRWHWTCEPWTDANTYMYPYIRIQYKHIISAMSVWLSYKYRFKG